MNARAQALHELHGLIAKETEKIDQAIRRAAGPLRAVSVKELETARALLAELEAWAAANDAHDVPARASYVFKRAINARTSLLRHTPALDGAPVSLAPEQAPGGTHLVDYARGGYVLELDPRFPEGVRFDDHPRLAALGRSISATLGRGSSWEPLLFTSGMGAIDTAIDLAVERSRGGRLLLGAHSWIEVKEYVDHTYPGRFEPIDEGDKNALRRALADPAVAAIVLEPLVNHPTAPVVPLEVLAGPIAAPKLLVLDLALTPELRLDEVLPTIPDGVTVALVTSGVKFFQAGWDLSKSGLLEVRSGTLAEPEWDRPYRQLVTLRGRSGRVPSIEEAELADLETADTLRSRLTRLDANTKALAHALADGLGARADVTSPWLSRHRHHERIAGAGTGGRFVYVKFDSRRLPAERLATFDRTLARAAKAKGLPLVVATTFGLSVPHVCLLAHPVEGLTLRLSPGSGDDRSAELTRLILEQVG